MYTNKKRYTEGLRMVSQVPVDDRLIKTDLADLIALGTDDYKAYEYYEGMPVFVVDENTYYKWAEDNSGTGPIGGFTYPANIISAGITYSNRTFDFVKINFSAGLVVEGTYAEILALAGQYDVDATYKITDRADAGIILKAATADSFHLEASGIFLNPDFQDIGALSGSMDGVWYAGGEAGYTNSEVVIWDGLHYQVIEDTAFDGTNPATNSLLPVPAYIVLPKTILNGYIEEVDFILYDFDNDIIELRVDKRNNRVNALSVNYFQWGNDLVSFNIVDGQGSNLRNQRGIFLRNQTNEYSQIELSNDFTGNFRGNGFFGRSYVTASGNPDVRYCYFNTSLTIGIATGLSFYNKTINDGYSNFDITLNMATAFAAGNLTIPASNNYIGIFNLSGSSGSNISKILTLPINHKVRFRSIAGQTQNFVHTAVAGLVAEQLVSNVVGTVTVNGTNDDFIEYEYSASTNGVKAGKKVADSIAA